MATRWIIVGSNRGIGLEIARQLVERGDDVTAVSRGLNTAMIDTDAVMISGVDVTSQADLDTLRESLDGTYDRLVVVAGVLERVSLDNLDLEVMRRAFEVNALAPLRVVSAVLPHLAEGAKVGLLTSRMGSIDDNTSGGSYAYRMSKAALNMAGKSLAVDLAPRNISVALLHPGYVRTEMTHGHGNIDPDEAATQLIARIDELTPSASGTFLHANGASLPW